MTPIWNDEIERIKQDPEASVFLVSFASQNEAKSTIHKLSFARQITKDGKTGLALPEHIMFKVGKSAEGKLWVLLAGRMSTDESLEAYELFGVHGNEQMIVVPSHVESQITGIVATPVEITPAQEPAKVTRMQAPAQARVVQEPGTVLSVQEPVAAKPVQPPAELKSTPVFVTPAQKPIEVFSTQTPVAVTKAQESTVVAPAKAPVTITPATEPAVVKAPQIPTEIEPGPIFFKAAQEPQKVAPVQEADIFKAIPTPSEVKPVPVVLTAAQGPARVTPFQEPAKVVSVLQPAKVSPVQPSVVAQPAQEPAVFKATPAPIVVKSPQAPVKVATLPEPGKVVPVSEPVKVTPTPLVTPAEPQKEDKRTSSSTSRTSDDQAAKRIYLARQGKREGPFALEHINAQIMAGRYKDDDFWAWHDGLPEWMPLYKIPGVGKPANGKSESA